MDYDDHDIVDTPHNDSGQPTAIYIGKLPWVCLITKIGKLKFFNYIFYLLFLFLVDNRCPIGKFTYRNWL